jgi:CubicO group peptidase (beta-lactamase class C family)
LIDQGKITFETLVGDYIPEMKNPIIVDEMSTENTTFRPATKAVTVQHLLNFSSGLFYPSSQDQPGLREGYSSKDMHQAADPVRRFFQIIKVCKLLLVFDLWTQVTLIHLIRENCLLCR